jgi:predicted ATP-grasp superfamily ATP-dependent carboligase
MPAPSDRAGSEAPNPERAAPGWPAAVIAGAYQTGVLGVRSLVRRGVRACCFDCHLDYPGFRSVYGPAHACPDPDIDPQGWVNFMIALAGKMGDRPVLIPSADQFVSAIAAHVDILAEHYLLSPGISLQGLLATKQTQYALAADHGMPLPSTKLVHAEEDVRRFASETRFPCLLKPLHFREWQTFPDGHPLSHQKVSIAQTPQSLLAAWRLAAAVNTTAIVQEIIEGPDTAKRVYVACYDRGGRRIGNAMFRELRCSPVGFGTATVSEPVVDPETDEVCDGWLRKLGYSGVCEIEMKWDSRDGRVKLIEANPRLTGGGDAAPYAGVDVCWLHYLDLIGKRVTPVAADGRDFRHIVLRPDLSTVIAYRRAGLISWADIVRSYRPPLAFYDFDPRDWRYSTHTLYLMVRSAGGELLRTVWPRRRPS